MTRQQLEALAIQKAQQYRVPPEVVLGVIWAESSWNPNAVSHAGAQGIMQLMPATARALGVSDPFDPVQNIDGGVRLLASEYNALGSWDLALAAYNAGRPAVQRYGGIPPYKETRNYVQKILAKLGVDEYSGPFKTVMVAKVVPMGRRKASQHSTQQA